MNGGERTILGVIEEKLDVLVRGMYGDEKNKVKGMLDRMDEVENNLAKLTTILKHIDEIPKMVAAYNFWTSKKTWSVISAAGGALYFLIANWGNIKLLFK